VSLPNYFRPTVPSIIITVTAGASKKPCYAALHRWTGRKVGFGPTPGAAVVAWEKRLNKAQRKYFADALTKGKVA
jgi:hypothetical protein